MAMGTSISPLTCRASMSSPVLNGDGQGNFTLKRFVEIDTLSKDVVSGDVNGDGKLDVVAISDWGYNIKVFLGDGQGSFQLSNVLNGDGEPNRLALVDLNKDGRPDILATAPDEGKLIIYLNLGGGTFSNSPIELAGYGQVVAVTTGDFNKDSKVDVAIAYFDNSLAGPTCRSSPSSAMASAASLSGRMW